MRKKILGACMVLSIFLVAQPSHAATLTSEQVSAVAQLLNSFGADASTVAQVQGVLSGQGASDTSSQGEISSTRPHTPRPTLASDQQGGRCTSLARNLSVGAQGNDVAALQKLLAAHPEVGFTASTTGYFGQLTAKAVARFQTMNGIASSTGVVGPATRTVISKLCASSTPQQTRQPQGAPTGLSRPPISIASGIVSAYSNSSITVQETSGSSTVVDITASTTIEVFISTSTPPKIGSIVDLVVGKTVSAVGKPNTDGSIAAYRIRVGFPTPPTHSGMQNPASIPQRPAAQ